MMHLAKVTINEIMYILYRIMRIYVYWYENNEEK